jgi:hypothetical protein
MQIKLFKRAIKDLQHLEAEVNDWLKANARSVTIQRDSHVYHNHATGEDDLVVMVWYGLRNEV